jgi:hypothetical protein
MCISVCLISLLAVILPKKGTDTSHEQHLGDSSDCQAIQGQHSITIHLTYVYVYLLALIKV